MNPLRANLLRCTLLVTLVAILITLSRSVPFAGADSNVVFPVQDNQPAERSEGRQLGIGVPKHIPIKIKHKNINSEKWSRDLEIEVKNDSDKPIYYLSFMVIPQGVKSPEGKEFMFWVHYGRAQLNDFTTALESTDRPLMPGESGVLKIDEAEANSWEITRSKMHKDQPSKVGLVFQMLNFGDGTGYANAQGTFFDIHRKVGLSATAYHHPGT
ncbi:MAG TPA: hypothetical protein VKB46_00025 [Pyrinomonadaceae bacterium]|nr:hypothetical protein [Pyrinomonadaceae bacterium]